MILADLRLHLHTTYSDGAYTFMEICGLAVKNNLKIISIIDRDETGVYKDKGQYIGLKDK